jgi:ribonuclease HIII
MSEPDATIRAMPGDLEPLPAPGSAAASGAGPAATDPDELVPHIGTDEAGKGDYFGPLVCAACYLDADVTRTLRALGVRDSKSLSDRRIRTLAEQIRAHLPGRFAVVTLLPPRYNSLLKNCAVRARTSIRLLPGDTPEVSKICSVTACGRSTRSSTSSPTNATCTSGCARTLAVAICGSNTAKKAESDAAVAAASILARDRFVGWLAKASETLGTTLRKGAGPQVITTARALVAAHGSGILREYAKVSFKTTRAVLDNTP